MNKRIVLIAVCLAALSAIGLAHAQGKRPLRVVPEVDLARYAGQWYEIARFPNRFQKRCAGEVTATIHVAAQRKDLGAESLPAGKRRARSRQRVWRALSAKDNRIRS